MNNEQKLLIFKNIVLFVLGFCLYCTIEVLFRGFSFASMGILGGLAVVIIDKINDRISWDMDLTIQALIGAFIITTMEFIVGEIALRTNILPVMWDYSDIALNIDGVICAPFMIAWAALSIIAIWVADAVNYYVFEDTETPYYMIFGKWKITFIKKKCDLLSR